MRRMPKTYKQSAVNAVILILVLILFIYLGAQFSKNFSTMVSTQRTQEITDVEYLHLKGYVFRYETPIERPAEGVCDYLLDDGSKVGVNQPYATYYRTNNAAEKQQNLDQISEQIRRLSSKSASGGTVADLSVISEALSSSYYSYINNVKNGDIVDAERRGNDLLDAIVSYRSVTTGWNDIESDVLKTLKNDKEVLLASLGVGESLVAEKGFYFFQNTDGYENIFSPEKLENISCGELDELIATEAEKYENGTIGKYVNSAEWFLVIPTDADTVMRFSYEIKPEDGSSETDVDNEGAADRIREDDEPEIGYYIGSTYSVTYSSDGEKSTKMVLDNAYVDENGRGYLIFSSYDLTLSAELSRAQDVKVEMSSVSGYRIPSDSLAKLDGEDGVYILVGTVVEFRRVTVVKKGEGYCIVKTYEEDRAELEKAEEEGIQVMRPPYLKVNDLIITSGNDLYDGKLLD